MTAVTVGMRKLKITLDAKESSLLLCGNERPSCHDPKTRQFLAAILKKALPKTDFLLDCDRLFVEIYPSALGGHIIYFTKAPLLRRFHKNPDPMLSLLLKFSDSSDSFALSKKFVQIKFSPKQSGFYKYKGEYCLILTASPSSFPYSLINEFADSVVCSDIAAAAVSEYGKALIKDNAVEIISRF